MARGKITDKEMVTLVVRVNEDIDKTLSEIASAMGRSKTDLIREGVIKILDYYRHILSRIGGGED